MPTPCCPFIKPDGTPCAARPLPDSDFCLFHDPAQAEAQAHHARRKGGAAPRRRCRRFPRLLDHLHVAELLGELFVDALNQTDASDTKRLQALTGLSRALLLAVGTAPTFLVHRDRSEPPSEFAHLRRLYPLVPPEEAASADSTPPVLPDPEHLNTRTPERLHHQSQPREYECIALGDGDAWNAAASFLLPDGDQPDVPAPEISASKTDEESEARQHTV